MAKNPAKFDRCVTDVQRSLKKAGRAGNAFAICQATKRNPTRWNPLVPLDPTTFLYGPSVLASIEKEREKIARGFGRKRTKKNSGTFYAVESIRSGYIKSKHSDRSAAQRAAAKENAKTGRDEYKVVPYTVNAKRRNLFGFGKKETYHARIVRGGSGGGSARPQLVSKFEGKSIYQLPDGDYTTSIDRDSHHDSLADAKAFIKSWKTNRGRKNGASIQEKIDKLVNDIYLRGNTRAKAERLRKLKEQRDASDPEDYSIRPADNGRMNPADFRLYEKAKKADDRFQAALQKAHGSRAGDMRYQTGAQPARIRKLGKAKEKADAAWLKSMRGNPGTVANPVPAAQERYASFHGHPSESLTKVRTPLHSHDVLAGIGELRKLKIKSANGRWKVTIKFAKPYPLLAMNEAATQLYIEGGDQSVNVKDFGIHTEHEKQNLGTVTDVYYFTHKDHLRPEDGGTAVYHHKFGKVKPTMVYDVPNQLLEFAGGGYTIPDEGIDQ